MKFIVALFAFVTGGFALFKNNGYINYAVKVRFRSESLPFKNMDDGYKYMLENSTMGGHYYEFDNPIQGGVWAGVFQDKSNVYWGWLTKKNPFNEVITNGEIVTAETAKKEDCDWGFLGKKFYIGKEANHRLGGFDIMQYNHEE